MFQYGQRAVLKGHSGAVTVADGLYVPPLAGQSDVDDSTVIVTASTDSTVKVWTRTGQQGQFGKWSLIISGVYLK